MSVSASSSPRERWIARLYEEEHMPWMREYLIRRGEQRFGPISAQDRERLAAVGQLKRLDSLDDLAMLPPVTTWSHFMWLAGLD